MELPSLLREQKIAFAVGAIYELEEKTNHRTVYSKLCK